MNKDSSDFMLEEYDRISTAYFSLRNQVNEWFKAYVTLIGLPLTVLAAVLKFSNDSTTIGISDLPIIVSALLIMVSLLGLFVDLSIISMRMEMILYARTINDIRRYFAELDIADSEKLKPNMLLKYLILPTSDLQPPFYEGGRAMFWQVLLIGILDGLIFSAAIYNLAELGWSWSSVIGVLFALVHWLFYWWMARVREKSWQANFKDNLTISNI